MVKINDKLNQKYRQQKDGVCEQDEELRLRSVAQSYAICENSIAVLSNLRTDTSHIYFGRVGEVLGFASADTYQKVDSVWEEEIYARIHPDDWPVRCLQELIFFRMVSASHSKDSFSWHLENTMRTSLGLGDEGILGFWTTPVQILTTTTLSFVIVALLSILMQRIPKIGKWLMG